MRYLSWTLRACMALVLSSLLATSFGSFSTFALTVHASSKGVQSTGTTCLQPPQNVDLTSLSDAALASYGLPSHAVIHASPAFWSVALAHAKHRTCGYGKSSRGRSSFPRSTSSGGKHLINSANWADNEATGSRGTYRAATLTFNVPTLASSNPSNAVDSVWTGVGGDPTYAGSNAVLPQAGVDAHASGTDGCGEPQYNESWWEVAGPNDPGATNLPLSRLCRQDRIYVYISSNLRNDGYDYFYISNTTISNYNSYTTYNSSKFSDSATGECVEERLGSLPVARPNPYAGSASNTIEIDGCEILDRNNYEQSVGNWPHIAYQIVNNSGKVLMYPKPLMNGGQDFLMQWVAYS